MKKIIALTLTFIILFASVFSVAANNGYYSISDITSVAQKICNAVDSNEAVPSEFKIGGETLSIEKCFQLITDAVGLIADNKSGNVVLNEKILPPINSNGNNVNIYAEKSEYVSIAKNASEFMATYSRVPNYGTSKFGKISYETMLTSFSRVLVNYAENKEMPSVIRLKYVAPFNQTNNTEIKSDAKIIDRIALMNASNRIQSAIRTWNKLPRYIMIDSVALTMPEFYYALAKLILDFSVSKINSIEIIKAEKPENNGESLKIGTITKDDYISMAREIVKETQKSGMIPSYLNIALGKVGMETGIYLFTEIVSHYRYKYYLPETHSLKTWKMLTGNEVPLPVETATATPRPTPTPYIGVGAMEGDEFETGAVGVYGAVSSGSKFASKIGLEILKAGGNAIDAAVATIFAVGLCEPSGSSIGGGGLSVIYLADEDKYIVFDYMSQTPGNLTGSGRANKAMTPGIVHGALSMLEKYGTMTREQVLAPTIKLAREGFEVTSTMAYKLSIFPTAYPYAASLYRNNGRLYTVGETYKNPDLANTLQFIADEGIEGFYNSEFTDMMCDYLIENGSSLTRSDFANYTSLERVPLNTTYRGYKVYAGSGTAQGGSRVVSMLNKMNEYDLAALGHDNAETVYITASAFGVRPSALISEKDDALLNLDNLEDCEWYDMKSTTMLVTYDQWGNMVASNNTLGDNFGCGVAVPTTGFCFNSGLNTSTGEPLSRIQSTMAPVIVAGNDGRPMLGVGSPGNSAIITATAITISNIIDFKMNVSQAIHAPRFYGSGSTLTIESRYSSSTLNGLRKMGYSLNALESYSSGVGCVSAIFVDDKDVIYAGADYRREYMAYAY